MTPHNALLCLAAAAVSLFGPHAAFADDAPDQIAHEESTAHPAPPGHASTPSLASDEDTPPATADEHAPGTDTTSIDGAHAMPTARAHDDPALQRTGVEHTPAVEAPFADQPHAPDAPHQAPAHGPDAVRTDIVQQAGTDEAASAPTTAADERGGATTAATPVDDSAPASQLPASAEAASEQAPPPLEVTKATLEKELAEVGEVYATGETLIEWIDPGIDGDYTDLWARIRSSYGMPELESTLVQRHEAWYLNRPEYMERMLARSRRYLFHIVEEVEKRGMPSEIALLPMIESGFNPTAYSHMHASGMWQFIPSTGRKYGLQQTWWYDGRRDVLEATRAALDYLQYLHDMFDDWQLALAAYNCGEGTIKRAIAKNRRAGLATNYQSLSLPKETRNYLPKLQAVKNIVTDPDLFNLNLEAVPNRPYFAVVTAPSHIDVEMAAKLANVSVDEIRRLNPAHYRPVIASKSAHQLLVPVDSAEIFQANLESNDQPLVTWQTYQLKRGERLDTVAAKFNISPERLREVNGLSGKRSVRPGQMLLVPRDDDSDTTLDETYTSADFQAPANDYNKRIIYRVKRGDTLASIARANNTTIEKLRQWNGLRGSTVFSGQRLTIWEASPLRPVAAKRTAVQKPGAAGEKRMKAGKQGKKPKAGKAPGAAKPAATKAGKKAKSAATSKAKPVAAKRENGRVHTVSR